MNFKLMIMKTTLKMSLVVALVFTALNVHAVNSELPLKSTIKDDGKKVSITVEEKKNVKMSIYDSNDDLVFRERITPKDNYTRTYDLASFPDGEYYLETESDLKISKFKIVVKDKEAQISSEAVSEVYKPVFVKKDGLVFVKLLNMEQTPVTIKILDSNDNEVYNTTFDSEITFGKSFKMDMIANNSCTFIVTFAGKTFDKLVKL